MIPELALSTLMVVLTVTIHGAGLLGLSRMLRRERREEAAEHLGPLSFRGLVFTLALVLGLFTLHGIEIWSYAFTYLLIDALPDLRSAVYYSTISYATVGYDDDGMASHWQLVGAIEGINGVLLMGWSTAFFVTTIGRIAR